MAKKKGKYEKTGRKAIKDNKLFYCSSKEMAILSLKVLDFISESSEKLSAKDARTVLKDAESRYLQLQEF